MEYPMIHSVLSGSVWAASESKMNDIRQVVNNMPQAFGERNEDPLASRGVEVTDEGVAVVPVYGTLMKRANIMTRYSGGTSSDLLANTFRSLIGRDDVKSVVLDVDSPGGSVNGVTNAASALRELADAKPVRAVANDMMASGAYWIASAADEVYVTRTATAGSIGVYVMLRQPSEDDTEKYTIVRAGEYKAKPNGAEQMTEEDVKLVQEKVDRYYAEFVSDISANLSISEDDAKQLADGRSFVGVDAVERGLADAVASLNDVVAMAADGLATTNNNEFQAQADPMEITQEQFDALNERVEALESRAEEAEARAEQAEGDLADARAEALISQYEDRIPAESRDKWVERAKSLGVEQTSEILSEMNPVMPSADEGTVTRDVSIQEDDNGCPRTSDGVLVAHNDTEAEVYSNMGVEFVRA